MLNNKYQVSWSYLFNGERKQTTKTFKEKETALNYYLKMFNEFYPLFGHEIFKGDLIFNSPN